MVVFGVSVGGLLLATSLLSGLLLGIQEPSQSTTVSGLRYSSGGVWRFGVT